MALFSGSAAILFEALAGSVALVGFALFWRGLRGGGVGQAGLLRGRGGMLGRMEGFRLMVFGLALIGVAAAAIWQAQWLLWLSLGIALVEILESSALIAVWRWDRRRTTMQRR